MSVNSLDLPLPQPGGCNRAAQAVGEKEQCQKYPTLSLSLFLFYTHKKKQTILQFKKPICPHHRTQQAGNLPSQEIIVKFI